MESQIDSININPDTESNTVETDSIQNISGVNFLPISDDFFIELTTNKDTLKLVTNDPYLYYPFGKYHSITAFKDKFNYFDILHIEKSSTDTLSILYELEYKNSNLKLFYDSEKETLEIVKGRIDDSQIILSNDIQVGMDKSEFLSHFFKEISFSDASQLNTIKLISRLDGIIHICTFKNNQLISIEFVTDYVF